MGRYDVYSDPSGSGYLIDIQADIMQPFNTRVVAPLLPLGEAPKPAKTPNPLFDDRRRSARDGDAVHGRNSGQGTQKRGIQPSASAR